MFGEITRILTDLAARFPVSWNPLLITAAIAGAIALFGTIRDHLHSRRRDLDKVSLIAWGKVSIFALIIAIACLARGLRSGS